MIPTPLETSGHRTFRIYLRDLSDDELDQAREQLELEVSGRIERDQNAIRLLSTTLSDEDVATALDEVCHEIAERQVITDHFAHFLDVDPGEAPL